MDKVLFASKKARVVPSASTEIVNLDSDDEETEGQKPLYPFQSSLVQQQKNQEDALPVTPQFTFEDIDLGKGKEMSCAIKDMVVISASRYVEEQTRRDEVIAIENGVVSDKGVYAGQTRAEKILAIENGAVNDKGVYVGVEDDVSDNDSESADEDLGNVWNEMAIGIMCSKVAVAHTVGHVAATVSMSKVAVSFTHIIKSGQSSGKSLVIENIVGRDFLPRGSGNMAKDL